MFVYETASAHSGFFQKLVDFDCPKTTRPCNSDTNNQLYYNNQLLDNRFLKTNIIEFNYNNLYGILNVHDAIIVYCENQDFFDDAVVPVQVASLY